MRWPQRHDTAQALPCIESSRPVFLSLSSHDLHCKRLGYRVVLSPVILLWLKGNPMPYPFIVGLIFLTTAVFAGGCRPSSNPAAAPTAGTTRLQGAGASFPAPFYKRLVVEYQGIHPGVLIDYQSIGSGGGIRAITKETVHFCGS